MSHALSTQQSVCHRPRATAQARGFQVTSAPITDAMLAQKAGEGDHIAFSELTHRYYTRCLRVAIGMVNNPTDAEDITQEAFVRAFRRLCYFEGKSSFYTWIYRIVVNLSIDHIRQRKRRAMVDLGNEDARDSMSAGQSLWPSFEDGQPETHVLNRELRENLEMALAQLGPMHQAVFVLREVEGLSYADIATTLKVKKGTVMSRLFHARQALQKTLLKQRRAQNKVLDLRRGHHA
jgi:RNA polymerase sigma-70 factor, ECF subfamily